MVTSSRSRLGWESHFSISANKSESRSACMRPLSFRLVDDLPFDCLWMRSMPSGSQAKSTSKISLLDAARPFVALGTANR